MAEEANAKNKNKLIAIIVGAVLAIAIVVVAVVLINNRGETLDDNFFKTDNSKIVISNSGDGSDPSVAKKVHQVYFVDGDKITGLKIYSEFESEQAAKDADARPEIAEAMKSGNYKDHKVQGKFIIITLNDTMYKDVTVEQLRSTAELLNKVIESTNNQTETESDSSSSSNSDSTSNSSQKSSEGSSSSSAIDDSDEE